MREETGALEEDRRTDTVVDTKSYGERAFSWHEFCAKMWNVDHGRVLTWEGEAKERGDACSKDKRCI
jgi:hypothetical protein